MTNPEKFKPCPFCGEKDNFSIGFYHGMNGSVSRYVYCKCGARGSGSKGADESGAIRAWNRRSDNDNR